MPASEKILGVGLSYRTQHHSDLVDMSTKSKPAWLEILADNYLLPNIDIKKLEEIAEYYPLVFHSTGLNLASPDPIDMDYLKNLKALCKRFGGSLISDHLCWNGVGKNWHHELLPFPFSEELLNIISNKLDQIQSVLNVPFAIENVSSYLSFDSDEINEAEFIAELCSRSSCPLLLDINNILVNERNLGLKAKSFLETVKDCKVIQIHVAGSREQDGLLIDDHGSSPSNSCLNMLREAYEIFGPVATCLEWDNNIPEFSIMREDLKKIEGVYKKPHEVLV